MSVIDTNITNPTISDHSAITFTLQSKEYAKRGPGFWKINKVSLYAIIIFIYIATTLPPQQTYRTHSPKLRLLLVLKLEIADATSNCL